MFLTYSSRRVPPDPAVSIQHARTTEPPRGQPSRVVCGLSALAPLTLVSSIMRNPSFSRSGPGPADCHSLLRFVVRLPRWPRYKRWISRQASHEQRVRR